MVKAKVMGMASTSPAAILLTTASSSLLMVGAMVLSGGSCADENIVGRGGRQKTRKKRETSAGTPFSFATNSHLSVTALRIFLDSFLTLFIWWVLLYVTRNVEGLSN